MHSVIFWTLYNDSISTAGCRSVAKGFEDGPQSQTNKASKAYRSQVSGVSKSGQQPHTFMSDLQEMDPLTPVLHRMTNRVHSP